MVFSNATQADAELLGVTPRQYEALAARYEDAIPVPYRIVAARLGVNVKTAWRLVRKGKKRLTAI